MSIQLDLRKLEEFDEMTLAGVSGATERLSGLTGVDTRVGYSRLNVLRRSEVIDRFDDANTVAISIPLEGYLDGSVVTAFDEESARSLAEAFMPMLPTEDGYTSKHESALEEICNVMVSGYVDGWANVKEESIVMAPPEVVSSALPEVDAPSKTTPETEEADDRSDPADEGASADSDAALETDGNGVATNVDSVIENAAIADSAAHVISQCSTITTPNEEVHFRLYLFLEERSMSSLIGSDGSSGGIEDETLGTLRSIADDGTAVVTENVGTLTGIEVEIDVSSFDLVPIERLSDSISDEHCIGSVIELSDDATGCLIVLFDEASAEEIVESFTDGLPDPAETGRSASGRDRSAIEEIANVIASSIVDGWADRFESSIQISPPTYVEDMRSTIVTDALVNIESEERFVLTFETTLSSEDVDLNGDIYTLISPYDIPDGWFGR